MLWFTDCVSVRGHGFSQLTGRQGHMTTQETTQAKSTKSTFNKKTLPAHERVVARADRLARKFEARKKPSDAKRNAGRVSFDDILDDVVETSYPKGHDAISMAIQALRQTLIAAGVITRKFRVTKLGEAYAKLDAEKDAATAKAAEDAKKKTDVTAGTNGRQRAGRALILQMMIAEIANLTVESDDGASVTRVNAEYLYKCDHMGYTLAGLGFDKAEIEQARAAFATAAATFNLGDEEPFRTALKFIFREQLDEVEGSKDDNVVTAPGTTATPGFAPVSVAAEKPPVAAGPQQ